MLWIADRFLQKHSEKDVEGVLSCPPTGIRNDTSSLNLFPHQLPLKNLHFAPLVTSEDT
jgi:hypothetical protein